MSWPAFHCDEPDFFVRSMRDDPPVKFGVLRKALSQSEIFRACYMYAVFLFTDNSLPSGQAICSTVAILVTLCR
jgi:hypothetical protein